MFSNFEKRWDPYAVSDLIMGDDDFATNVAVSEFKVPRCCHNLKSLILLIFFELVIIGTLCF